MSKGPYSVKESELRRVLHAARKEGADVRIEINLEQRSISIVPLKPGEPCESVAATDLKDLL